MKCCVNKGKEKKGLLIDSFLLTHPSFLTLEWVVWEVIFYLICLTLFQVKLIIPFEIMRGNKHNAIQYNHRNKILIIKADLTLYFVLLCILCSYVHEDLFSVHLNLVFHLLIFQAKSTPHIE